MAKATHTGTCQICGCNQKLPNGRLSKHGYTTQWGFFSGVCSGASHLPFEQSTNLIQDVVATVKRSIISSNEKRAELLEMTDACKIQIKFHDRRVGTTELHWVSAPADTMFISGWSGTGLESSYTEDRFYGYSTETFKCAYIYTGRERDGDYENRPTLEELIKRANAEYVKSVIDRDIAQMENYIEWQEKRLAEWVEKPLTPVSK